MSNLLGFIKRNWLVIGLTVLVIVLLRRSSGGVFPQATSLRNSGGAMESAGFDATSKLSPSILPVEPAPTTGVTDRLVIKSSNLSLLVKSVRDTQDLVIKKAQELGGYMVDSALNSPEGVDSATVSVRVPSVKLDEFLKSARSASVRVVSENLEGYDVTDQYVDLAARLETLNKTKAKFEQIMAQATIIQDILTVQRELISLQDQIDSLKGQQQYLEKSAEMAKVTIYLATDELALPYAPAQPWKPEAIFKTAVRSLVSSLRGVATALIWIAVFSVIWVPALVIILLIRRRFRRG